MKLNLVESKGDRNIVMSKASESSVNLVDLLKKYGKVVDYMTEPMVADFYKVTNKTIHHIGDRNKTELEQYGYKAYKKSEAEKLLKPQGGVLENIPNRGLRLYPIKSVIVIGMMLTESEVAKKLRKDIIDILFNDDRKIELARKAELLLDIYNGGQEGKMASDEGFVIGERKLYKKLREWGYICNGSTEPTQVGMNRNYFTLKINVVQTPYGIKSSRTTLVTPRGQIHIVERLMKEMES